MASPYLQYRTFEEALADVRVKLKKIDLEGHIDESQIIPVTRKLNSELGIKLNPDKWERLEVENYRVKMPSDFMILHFAAVAVRWEREQFLGAGIETTVTPVEVPGAPSSPCGITVNQTSQGVIVKHVMKTKTECCRTFEKIHLKKATCISNSCPNTRFQTALSGYIEHRWLHTNFQYGSILVNYAGMLENAEGDLLVPDDPLLNDYYTWSYIQEIFENMWFSGEDSIERKLGYVSTKLREARNTALSKVNMPDFKELQDVINMNRIAQYKRYYGYYHK